MVDRIVGPSAAPQANAAPPRGTVLAGIRSGLAGGLVMFLVVALSAGIEGLGWLHPLEAIGTTLVGAGTSGGAAAVAGGALLHAVASAVFGVGLAAVLPDDFPPVSAAAVGGAYGLFTAGLMMSLVVPLVNPAFRALIQPVGGSWTIGHIGFGATLGLALTLRHWASRRAIKRAASVAGTARPVSQDRAR